MLVLTLAHLKKSFWRGDSAFALGMVVIISILMVPIPRFMLDFLLALSIAFSVLIFLTTLFIEKPLDFSSFPTILLVSTLLRLSLNVASTRLILTYGHEGAGAAGHVIEAFGQFVIAGNFIIGFIVFTILLIINFVVITKGSGRIAEVSARFSLDAMPGKQMAIDAELSSGLLSESQAKKKRKDLEEESNFYGAMDGASKFVRGDAIAAVLITFINIIGGIVIGMLQKNLSLQKASETYTILTVGDGLVAQIPALIVSTAAGLIISKGAGERQTHEAFLHQLGASSSPLSLCSFLIGGISLIPSIPFWPFAFLAVITGWASWKLSQSQESASARTVNSGDSMETEPSKGASVSTLSSLLPLDPIRLELGYGLLELVQPEKGGRLAEQIKNLRNQMHQTLGVLIPSIRIQDSIQLQQNQYQILIKDIEIASGEVYPRQLLVMSSKGNPITLKGELTREPTFGLPSMWIAETMRGEAERQNLTIVEPSVVLITHLNETLKDNITDLLTYGQVQEMLDDLTDSYKKLLSDIIPSHMNITGIQRVLQNLVAERISIRDFQTILEGISEGCGLSRHITMITEYVRLRLARQITFSNVDIDGMLKVVTLSPHWEETIQSALIGEGESKQLAMAPSEIQTLVHQIAEKFDRLAISGNQAVLVTSPMIRPYVRSVLERTRPSTVVISHQEIYPKIQIKNLGVIE
jgi:flagellar biosynthesis protein FlhA